MLNAFLSPSPVLPAPDTYAAFQFLEYFRDAKLHHIVTLTENGEIRNDSKGREYHVVVAETHAIVVGDVVALDRIIQRAHTQRSNVYFPPAQVEGPLKTAPNKRDVVRATCLWADIDPEPGEAAPMERLARMKIMGLPPTVTVHSGRGLQAWWMLTTPFEFTGGPDTRFETFEEIGAAIAHVVAADAVQNVNRLMRLPGTVNWPNANKRRLGAVPALARVIDADPAALYDAAAFEPVVAIRAAMYGASRGAPVHFYDGPIRMHAEMWAMLPEWQKRLIENEVSPERPGDRSSHSFNTIITLLEHPAAFTIPEIIMLTADQPCMAKYVGRRHGPDAEIERIATVWRKKGAYRRPNAFSLPEEQMAPLAPIVVTTHDREGEGPQLGVWGNSIDEPCVPAADWVVPSIAHRRLVTVIAAPGGAGKSTLELKLAAAAAIGANFGPIDIPMPCKSVIINAEDEREDMSLKLWAECLEECYDYETVRKSINLLDSRDFNFRVTLDRNGKLNEKDIQALILVLSDPDVGLCFIDPLVYTHDLDESSNPQMAYLMGQFRRIAQLSNTAIILAHHTRKDTDYAPLTPGDANDSRGAGAIIANARFAYTFYNLSKTERAELGIPADEIYDYVRLDNAKNQKGKRRVAPIHFRWRSTVRPNGETVGTLAYHLWDEYECDSLTHIGQLIFDLQTKNSKVPEKDLMDAWVNEHPGRTSLSVTSIRNFMHRQYWKNQGCFTHTDEFGTYRYVRIVEKSKPFYVIAPD